jgi:uncharacterized protein
MNNKLRLLLLILWSCAAYSATAQPSPLTDRSIEVTGEGELKIDPNIINLSIELKEYRKESRIIKLEELEAQLQKIVQNLGIPRENLKAYGSSGRQLDQKTGRADVLTGKRYVLKLANVELLNPVLAGLSEANIFGVTIMDVTHTDIEKYKMEVKVKAINDAREKAALLTTSLQSKVGQVLQIREAELAASLSQQPGSVHLRGPYNDYEKGQMNTLAYEQIKLTYKVVVKFKIE